ncbi:MAG: hypothetical protein Q4B69_06140 [Slackia sp.]|nr:hypothetical protein [Slackia sp.]
MGKHLDASGCVHDSAPNGQSSVFCGGHDDVIVFQSQKKRRAVHGAIREAILDGQNIGKVLSPDAFDASARFSAKRIAGDEISC